MRKTRNVQLTGWAAWSVLSAGLAWAQEGKPFDWGGFQTQGSAEIGYRLTDISGRR